MPQTKMYNVVQIH